MPISDFVIVRHSDADIMVRPEEKPISAYILRVMKEEGWGPSDVLSNAKELKIKLRQSTFSEIYTGETSDPRVYTLIDISRALHRPFEEMVAVIEGTSQANQAAFTQSDFALMSRMYERLNAGGKRLADHFIEMVKAKLVELLKQQGETNPHQIRR